MNWKFCYPHAYREHCNCGSECLVKSIYQALESGFCKEPDILALATDYNAAMDPNYAKKLHPIMGPILQQAILDNLADAYRQFAAKMN